MAIRRILKKKFKKVNWRSGHIYSFSYSAWENDPKPTIILMYALQGTHPRTGHQWRFFQGINFSYIPRAHRRAFANEWKRVWERTNGNLRFTYQLVQRRYPFMMLAIRRYFFKPTYYIKRPVEIPFDDLEQAIVSTWSKDFSKKVKVALVRKYRDVLRNRRIFRRTGRFPRRI